jgi:hypothetical protein
VRVRPFSISARSPVSVLTRYMSDFDPPHCTSVRYIVSTRPIAQRGSGVGVTLRMTSSDTRTSLPLAMLNTAGSVARRSCARRTICTDCTSASFQCHTSTFACGSAPGAGGRRIVLLFLETDIDLRAVTRPTERRELAHDVVLRKPSVFCRIVLDGARLRATDVLPDENRVLAMQFLFLLVARSAASDVPLSPHVSWSKSADATTAPSTDSSRGR